MNYKVKVIIDGRTYNLSTDTNDGYTERVAAYVDREIANVTEQLHASTVNAATITAMNIADRFFRQQQANQELRDQLEALKAETKSVTDAQKELEALRQQVAQLTGEKETLRQQLDQSSDLRGQLKDALNECARLRREIVRMGKNG